MWVQCCFLHKYQTIHGLPPHPCSSKVLSAISLIFIHITAVPSMKEWRCAWVWLSFFLSWKKLSVSYYMFWTQSYPVVSVLSRLGHNPAKQEQFLVWVPPVGPHCAVHRRSGVHSYVGVHSYLRWAALVSAPSLAVSSAFSLKNVRCSFPGKENIKSAWNGLPAPARRGNECVCRWKIRACDCQASFLEGLWKMSLRCTLL